MDLIALYFCLAIEAYRRQGLHFSGQRKNAACMRLGALSENVTLGRDDNAVVASLWPWLRSRESDGGGRWQAGSIAMTRSRT